MMKFLRSSSGGKLGSSHCAKNLSGSNDEEPTVYGPALVEGDIEGKKKLVVRRMVVCSEQIDYQANIGTVFAEN